MTETLGSPRRERQLGWITLNGQEYPRHSAADWIDALRLGLCPFCGAGPFTVVASHVSRRHDLGHKAFRDLLGISVTESICDPTHAKAMSSNAAKRAARTDMVSMARSAGGVKHRRTRSMQERWRRMRLEHPCVVCGKETGSGTRRTCSDECWHLHQVGAGRLSRAMAEPRPVEMFQFVCPECGAAAAKPASVVRSNLKHSQAGPFCSRSCAARDRRRRVMARPLS